MTIYSKCIIAVLVAGFFLGNLQVHGAPLTEYIIWPREGITGQDVDNVESRLKSLLVNGTGLYTSESASRPIPNFWLANLDHDSYENVAKHPKIVEISPNEDYCQGQNVALPKVKSIATNTTAPIPQAQTLGSLDVGRRIFDQDPALNELRMISQAPNTPLTANPGFTYSFDETEETFIYIPDYGINRAHWEFSTPSRRIEWLYTPQTILHHHDTPTELQWPYPSFFGAHSTYGPGFVTRLPAKISDRKDNLWGPIVVGAVDDDGEKAPFSEELRYGRMLWAPGVDIGCAAGPPEISKYETESGTSFGKWNDHLLDSNCANIAV
ncbi:MAG: hypothetical protein Q9192_004951, partial [Flavoplaca navasiana]